MTRNLTIRCDDELLQALRHQAVDAHMSLSAWVVTLLQRSVPGTDDLAADRERALQHLRTGLHLGGRPLDRDAIHER